MEGYAVDEVPAPPRATYARRMLQPYREWMQVPWGERKVNVGWWFHAVSCGFTDFQPGKTGGLGSVTSTVLKLFKFKGFAALL